MTPDWKLPIGTDRGLWDYMQSEEMAADYDRQMAESPLARFDLKFCQEHFPKPGTLLDLGCGTGRLCQHFAQRGFECVGVDLSAAMLARAPRHPKITWIEANIVELQLPRAFDYAACLYSTFGMIRGDAARRQFLANVHRMLKPRGTFVLHAHHRWFGGLGWKRWFWRDFHAPQAYGGAELSLRHFSRSELRSLLARAGFDISEERTFDVDMSQPPRWPWQVYGVLLACTRSSLESL